MLMNTPKPRLFLNPHCPRFATTPKRPDGSFDNEKFGQLLAMQETGATLNQFIEVMSDAEMEQTPMVRQKVNPLTGEPSEDYECAPETFSAMPDDVREMFDLVGA